MTTTATTKRAPLTNESAIPEIAWIARRGRELAQTDARSGPLPELLAQWVEYYERKAALLGFINEPEMAVTADVMAASYRRQLEAWDRLEGLRHEDPR